MATLEKIQLENICQETIDRFWEAFPPVWDRIQGNLRMIATDQFNITVKQYQILRQIQKGRDSVSELATVKQISRSAVSQVVEVLVQKGFINRRQDAVDRRYKELELTPSGTNLLRAIFEKNRDWMMGKMELLSPEEANSIIQGVNALKKTFN